MIERLNFPSLIWTPISAIISIIQTIVSQIFYETPKVNQIRLTHIITEIKTSERSFLRQLLAIPVISDVYLRENILTDKQARFLTSSLPKMLLSGELFLQKIKKTSVESIIDGYRELLENGYTQQIDLLAHHHYQWNHIGLAEIDQKVFPPPNVPLAWIFPKYKRAKQKIQKRVEDIGLNRVGSLSSVTILPVQRLPRHVLLLKEILKSIPSSSSKYDEINEIMEILKSRLKQLNQSFPDSKH